jgi:hypothetical protein
MNWRMCLDMSYFLQLAPTPDLRVWNDGLGNDEGDKVPCIVIHEEGLIA